MKNVELTVTRSALGRPSCCCGCPSCCLRPESPIFYLIPVGAVFFTSALGTDDGRGPYLRIRDGVVALFSGRSWMWDIHSPGVRHLRADDYERVRCGSMQLDIALGIE